MFRHLKCHHQGAHCVEILYVILARHNELPEDDILNVETCRSMLFVIVVFDIIVESLVKIVNNILYV